MIFARIQRQAKARSTLLFYENPAGIMALKLNLWLEPFVDILFARLAPCRQ